MKDTHSNPDNPLDYIKQFLSKIEFENGVVVKFNEITEVAKGLLETKKFPNWIEGIDLLGFCLNEAAKFKKAYNGKMSDDDLQVESLRIEQKLNNIPLEYEFYFEMPEGLKLKKGLVIAEGIKIFQANDEIMHSISESNTSTYREKIIDFTAVLHGLPEKVEPKYKNLQNGKTYLSIKTKGLVSNISTITVDIDPLHVYKILIAFMKLKNILNGGIGGLLQEILGRGKAETHGKEALVFDDKLIYITSIDRPLDEYKYVSKLAFSDEIQENPSKLKDELADFSSLIVEMKNYYLNQERNKIINSLYWYFESLTSTNSSFKTVLLVSMFDSFFSINDNKEDKFKQILLINNPALKPSKESDEWKALSALYNNRNDIAHGKVHLLEVDSKNKENRDMKYIHDSKVQKLYDIYIQSKIDKLLVN